MPTASPMKVSMFTTKKLSGEMWPMRAASASATTMEKRASTTGTSAATTVPNTASRIRSAMGMPIASPVCRSLSDSWVKSRLRVASPVTSTRNPPCPFARSARAITGPIFVCAWSTSLPGMLSGIRVLCRSCETSAGSWVW